MRDGMTLSADLLAACAIVLLIAVASASHAVRAALFGPRDERTEDDGRTVALPVSVRTITVEVLSPIARSLASAGVSANAITGCSLFAGAIGGVLLAFGHFGAAAFAIVLASFGDAVDGLVARRTRTASPGGALFDASVDRYEEFFVLGGLAFYFRENEIVLALALLALLGSFMVSYGSAKAEALGVAVPRGIMRRAERAFFLAAGVTMVPIAGAAVRFFALPTWIETSPVVAALAVVAIVANASAAMRLRAIAHSASPVSSKGQVQPMERVHVVVARASHPEVPRESTVDAAE
jgi:CDP-diacylglycerol--glycerol-3-phosphate 3-phosphatidyltransferase